MRGRTETDINENVIIICKTEMSKLNHKNE